mgnify:FL=1|jgi:hypothetical protein|tara:strand:+ start:469 stop:669 length:201 start_codon:yes stop_codon:yes gene_type:complete
MKTFDRYKQNLKQVGNAIISYDTHVATIHGNTLKKMPWWVDGVGASSYSTSRHINYVARELNLEVI